ncbi:nitrous oxide reductase accessory protein NosL [Halobacillus sp. A1]|uniref:nitrous oxide reductase accessory protein NosL n=1 Tax=Halobacillus sp. A1 TaxID=2880262 RepID=UPI0020A6AE84|nr:nitrous oxide reductase accessory protein NosL [Halobacillus sp. A1]MCP3033341.1 nitrous oxide reductase accessory protein NosL [Halobacillus sp. A1]
MNKRNIALFSSIIVSASVMTACGSGETDQNSSSGADQQQETPEDSIQNMSAQEPGKDETCYYCEMGIPHPEDDHAVFTAQAITQDGERVFFDDSGCVENAEEENEEFAKIWVKDFDSKEWVELDGTSVVYDESLNTPMSYHYAFFKSNEDAKSYADEQDAELASWEDVQEDASERSQDNGMDKDSSDHEDMDMEGHDQDQMDEENHEHSDENHNS